MSPNAHQHKLHFITCHVERKDSSSGQPSSSSSKEDEGRSLRTDVDATDFLTIIHFSQDRTGSHEKRRLRYSEFCSVGNEENWTIFLARKRVVSGSVAPGRTKAISNFWGSFSRVPLVALVALIPRPPHTHLRAQKTLLHPSASTSSSFSTTNVLDPPLRRPGKVAIPLLQASHA